MYKELSANRIQDKYINTNSINRKSFFRRLIDDRFLLLLMLPGIIYYIIFRYLPMFGVVIAFQNFSYKKGILGSTFVGLKHFVSFVKSPNFTDLLLNTVIIGLYNVIFTLPAAILFAILLNELVFVKFRKLVQSVSLMPYFISTVVTVGIAIMLLSPGTGIVNKVITLFGHEPVVFLAEPGWFRAIYIITEIWQKNGWLAVIFTASIVGIDPNLYEASSIDGAGRFKKIIYITLPSMFPVIAVMLILKVGQIMSLSFEKTLLLQNPLTYSTSDIIDTFTYRRGLLDGSVSFASAVGLFKGVISLILVYFTNLGSKKLTNKGIW